MWSSINAAFLTADIDGKTTRVPVDTFFIQDPRNTNTLYNITQPINVLADGGLAFTATLLNGEVLTLGFEIPALVDTYAMSEG
jgi:hypothetical protein